MVRTTTKITTLALATFLCMAGFAAASPLAIFTGDGGGEASGQADASYYADATGALDAADENKNEAHSQAKTAWAQSNAAYDEAKAQAEEHIDNAEAPAMPEDTPEEDLLGELDQASNVNAEHTDKVEKAMDVETDYVNAGADLSAAGHVKAFFQDTFKGVKDAFTGLKDQLSVDTSATEDAKSTAKTLLHADDDLRSQASSIIEEDRPLPELEPRVDGNVAGEHASKVTSEITGDGTVEIPE